MTVEGNLGDRITVMIDPAWQHGPLWDSPLGNTLRVTFLDLGAGISEGAAPNYQNTEIVGRAESYKAYINTGNRQINLPFKFRAQGLFGSTRASIEAEVINPARFLDALKYPVHDPNQNLSFAPPPVLVRFGELFIARCVLVSGDIQWLFDSMETDTLLPHGADFNAQFEVVRAFNSDLSYFSGGPEFGDWL